MNYKNNKRILFILIIFSIIFLYAIKNIKIKNDAITNDLIFSIQFEYFGMDAKQIENLITIPLEKKLFELDYIKQIKSSSEYNQMRTTVWFHHNANKDSSYLEIRKIVEDLYSILPQDVQKPKIYYSDIEDKAAICISIYGSKTYIEKNIKPKFESIDDVAIVEILGGNNNQLNIQFDNFKLSNLKLQPYSIQNSINNLNQENIFSIQKNNQYKNYFFFKNKSSSISDFSCSTIFNNKENIPTNQIADFFYSPQDKTEIILLNNNETIFLNIKTQSNSNLIKISDECKKILNERELKELSPVIMYDEGQVQKEKLLSVLATLFQTILINSLIIFIFYQSFSFCLLTTFIIFTTLFWTLGTLSILKIPITTNSLVGISISIGLISDVPLILIETFKLSATKINFAHNLSKNYRSIITSSITTILVLIPLFYINNIIPGIFAITITILFMLIYSVFLSLFCLPSFLNFKHQKENILTKKLYYFKTVTIKKLLNLVEHSLNSKVNVLFKIIFFTTCFLSILLIIFSNKQLTQKDNQKITYINIEFNPEKNIEAIKKQISNFISEVKKIEGIKFIKTQINRGNADMEIIYSTENKTQIIEKVSNLTNLVPEAFIYIPQSQKTKDTFSLQVAITGPNEEKCRAYVKQIAATITSEKLFKQIVLNFKDNEQIYFFEPNNILLAKNNLSAKDISHQLRINNFGSVIGKFFLNSKETDIRIKSNFNNTFDNLNLLNFVTPSFPLQLKSIGEFKIKKMPSTIYRINSLPCAYFTVGINSKNIKHEISKLSKQIHLLNMPDEYNFFLPISITENQTHFFMLYLIILICILLVFLFLISQNEKLKLSSKIIFSIPSTFFLPLLLRIIFYKPLSTGDIVGIILLSGITINNVIYIADSTHKKLINKIESKIHSILITSITTILGSLPMMLSFQNQFAADLSFFMFWGTISSTIICLFLFPSIYE